MLKVRGPENSEPPRVESDRNPQILIGGNRHHTTRNLAFFETTFEESARKLNEIILRLVNNVRALN